MSSANLEQLPMEVLINICEAVNLAHHPSVISFALTSRQCSRAASPVRFRSIRFEGEGPEQLSDDVVHWNDILARTNCYASVRDLHIEWQPPYRGLGVSESVEEKEMWSVAWEAMAQLIGRLGRLTDLTYDSSMSFPSAILSILHSNSRTNCRLHIDQFRLRSLRGPYFDDNNLGNFELSADDMLLATSPCLYSIRMQPANQQRLRDFNLLAVKQLVQGGNPNLKAIEVCRKPRNKGMPPLQRLPGQRIRNWSGIPAAESGRRAALKSLDLAHNDSVSMSKIEEWHGYADFESLQNLKLSTVDLAELRWLGAHGRSGTSSVFPRLVCLDLEIGRSNDDESARDLASATQEVLRCLLLLEDLTLSGRAFGDYSEDLTGATLAVIMQHHGQNLRRLSLVQSRRSLPAIKNADDAQELVKRCPQLQHLDVSMTRSEGDLEEVAIYQHLGGHPQLQSISLTLDCAENVYETNLLGKPFDETPWNGHQKIQNGHVRKSLINCALDESLAVAIFHTCAAAKPPGATVLQNLKIKASNTGIVRITQAIEDARGMPIYPRRLHPIFEHLGKNAWTVVPHPSDTHQGEVVTEKVEGGNEYGTDLDQTTTLGPLESSFRALWAEGTTGDWRDEWCSFPLAE